MKLNDRLGTLPQDAQLRVMERVFQKLLLAFGNQMQAKWHGLDMQAVYQDWAEALYGCSLGAIDNAIYLAKQSEHPPNQGEFKELCRLYKPPVDESTMLADKSREWSPVTKEKAQENLARIKAMLAKTPIGAEVE